MTLLTEFSTYLGGGTILRTVAIQSTIAKNVASPMSERPASSKTCPNIATILEGCVSI
jgi:hypothetical protein